MSVPPRSPSLAPSCATSAFDFAFHSIHSASTTNGTSDGTFTDAMFAPVIALPVEDLPITAYDAVDYQHLAYSNANVCGVEDSILTAFHPTFSYFTPTSEASDFSDALTPVSLQPAFEFACAPVPGSLQLNTNIALNSPERPHSSPSTFGPPLQRLTTPEPTFKPKDGLQIRDAARLTPASSPKPQRTPSISSVSDTYSGQPRKYYTPIAPHPVGLLQLQAAKRAISEEESDLSPSKKRKLSTTSSSGACLELTDEEALLLRLKDDETMTWKDIAMRFQTDLGKSYQIPALQMRLKRLRERMRVWTEVDVQALRQAHEYWLNNKFEIISQRMADYGASENWSAKQCYRKWQEVGFSTENVFGHPLTRTPTFSTSYTSSPIETPNPNYYPFVSPS